MKIKQLSELTGLSQKTIRYYEAQGLISPQWETRNGKRFRDYTEADLDDLNHVAALRRAMFTVDEIRTLQDQPDRIGEVLLQYRRRMETLARESALLVKAAKHLEPGSLEDYKDLSDRLVEAARQAAAPEKREIELHFGRFDPEELSREERWRLKRDRENNKARIVFYNLTNVSARSATTRAELAGISPTNVERLGIASTLWEDWDSARDWMKEPRA